MANKPKPRDAGAGDDTSLSADEARAKKGGTDEVHEFVLFRKEGDDRIPVMSDADLDVVKAAKITAIQDAAKNGRPRPELFVVDRKCTYPLSGGKRQAQGSECEESEV